MGIQLPALSQYDPTTKLVHFARTYISTTPITAMGCRQCLPLSVVQLKGKHTPKTPNDLGRNITALNDAISNM